MVFTIKLFNKNTDYALTITVFSKNKLWFTIAKFSKNGLWVLL